MLAHADMITIVCLCWYDIQVFAHADMITSACSCWYDHKCLLMLIWSQVFASIGVNTIVCSNQLCDNHSVLHTLESSTIHLVKIFFPLENRCHNCLRIFVYFLWMSTEIFKYAKQSHLSAIKLTENLDIYFIFTQKCWVI